MLDKVAFADLDRESHSQVDLTGDGDLQGDPGLYRRHHQAPLITYFAHVAAYQIQVRLTMLVG